jgi:hypothetical protein
VWTPKRVLLLALGFALLFGSYLIYAAYLGGIDGLPPLPESCLPSNEPAELPGPRPNLVDERLEMAFGKGCPELFRPIRLEVHSKGVVLSTDDFHIMRQGELDAAGKVRDGQVRLKPLSLALFSKKTPPGQYPDITTVRAKQAYLTFDRPISNMGDMAKAKIIGAELHDQIELVNNRRQPNNKDELKVWVAKGPVYYQERPRAPTEGERKPEIWTATELRLTDYQSKPNPTQITAEGMEMFLTSEAPDAPAPRKPRNETVTGVDRIRLGSNVRMEFDTDPHSGFLSNNEKPRSAAPPAQGSGADAKKNAATPAAKVPVVIVTPGPFLYDVQKDLALFNVPADPNQPSPHDVLVTRSPKPGQFDQLCCDRLEVQFRRKKNAQTKTAPEDDRSVELEIETAHATGREVVLTSDITLIVKGANDLFYDARTRETFIKGEQKVIAVKDLNELEAPLLHLREENGIQHITAIGRGKIVLRDKETKGAPSTATWSEKLISSKEGDQDVLLLIGDAAFRDEEHEQFLQANELKVWLEPSPKADAQPAPQAQSQGGRRPQRVEATEHVVAKSPEMNVHDTDKLILTFSDAPRNAVASAVEHQSAKPIAPNQSSAKAPTSGAATPSTAAATGKQEPAKPARPIDLSAHRVEARVLRQEGGKNELDHLWTEGQVLVQQAPEKPEEKGLDIKGDTLELIKQLEGNRLIVTGDVAELQIDKLFIRGPQVEIDQAENEAWVKGVGALTMKNNTSFNGNKLDHEVDMTVYWSQYMHFKGENAQFTGSIQAEQENARLQCHTLQVKLDRPISFRDGQKNGSPAKVDRMVCDKTVSVEDREYAGDKLIKWQKIECRVLEVDNTEGQANASGPGTVRIYQLGDAGPQSGPLVSQSGQGSGKPKDPHKDQEMKLTIVHFGRRMWADNKAHMAKFYDNIEVVNFATEDKDVEPDLDRLPPDAVYVTCTDQLIVYNRSEDAKSNQQLEAIGRVKCFTKDYVAQCDKMSYNEAKDQLIFDGGEGGWARMRHVLGQGIQGQDSQAKQFIYSRKTNQIQSSGGRSISGTTPP